jgi:hypothetical protein
MMENELTNFVVICTDGETTTAVPFWEKTEDERLEAVASVVVNHCNKIGHAAFSVIVRELNP